MSWILPLIIIMVCPFVNAATFKEQVKTVVTRGETSSFTTSIADSLGFERNLPYRAIEIEDGAGIHGFAVILKNDQPLCVIIELSSDTATELHSEYYRVNVIGKLEKGFRQFGRYDTDHKPVRGSGVITDLELTAEVKAAFRRELDFWLKGSYRKPKSAAAPAAHVTPVH